MNTLVTAAVGVALLVQAFWLHRYTRRLCDRVDAWLVLDALRDTEDAR